MRDQFETNVFGSMELITRILPVMQARAWTDYSKQFHSRYCDDSLLWCIQCIKFAIEGFCNTLRQELHDTPIHVSIINPGPIKVNYAIMHARI